MTSSPAVWRRRNPAGYGYEQVVAALRDPKPAAAITKPSTEINELNRLGNVYTFQSFTTEDALELGTLLQARLLPLAQAGRPTLISVSLSNSSQVVFQTVTGPGITPDNELWATRKRNAVLRFGASSWFLGCKFQQNEDAFEATFRLSREQGGRYAIKGGGVAIRVRGVEGTVAVVVVSGLSQEEDHGVIMDVIAENWEAVSQ
ncbi:hypothetical protein ACRALDRAFT_1062357 [Sodiomyces alcalophilus JCM 7366]|uniref:uncharacterized protein n=1 Tax=Sodiomyces alcalophilus JCM 7366 TaxID=591952 RepID=UPI0039B542B0